MQFLHSKANVGGRGGVRTACSGIAAMTPLEFTHAGANAGYRCVLVGFPEQHEGAAIMTNSDSGDQVMYALSCISMSSTTTIDFTASFPSADCWRRIQSPPSKPGCRPI